MLLLRLLLTVMFYVVVTPLSLALRVFGFDPLALRAPRQTTTYWTSRANASSHQVQFTKVR
jgi:hypothetical protein